jgi:hypothetical protein
MTPDAFKQSLSEGNAPKGVSPPLAALWWAGKGEWDKAHGLVMDESSREAAWVHAYLHRVEGDLDNARYWYRQARRPEASGKLEEEWQAIAAALLEAA